MTAPPTAEPEGIAVRPARRDDLPGICRIYDHHVRHTAVTFDVEPPSLEARIEWLAAHPDQGPHRALVAISDGEVAGFASSSRLRPKAAYATSVELSVYVDSRHHRRGIARALYGELVAKLQAEGVHRAYAGVTLPNEASERLHQKLGFHPVGTYDEVGFKLGQYHSVRWYELRIT